MANLFKNMDASCRFCLRFFDMMIPIDEAIEKHFKELTSEDLLDDPRLPQKSCHGCAIKLRNCVRTKISLKDNQKMLVGQLLPEFGEGFTQTVKKEPEDNFVDVGSILFSDINCSVFAQTPKPKEEIKLEPYAVTEVDCEMKPTSSKSSVKKTIHSKEAEKDETPTNSYCCDICGQVKRSKRLLIRHMQIHKKIVKKNDLEFDRSQLIGECRICKKRLNLLYLQKHMKHVHLIDPEPKICDRCGLILKSEAKYLHHFRSVHTKIQPFECQYCHLKFFSAHSLHAHLNNKHFNDEKSICHICSKVCSSKNYLRSHINSCHKSRKFVCEFEGCGMKFIQKHHLQNHMNCHSEMRRFSCHLCNTAYKTKSTLNSHIYATHLKTKFNCRVPGCSTAYFRKDFMRKHIKRAHKSLPESELENYYQQLRDIPYPSLTEFYESAKKL